MASLLPLFFGQESIAALRAINQDVYMLTEAEEDTLAQVGFDATYGWQMHHLMNDVARGAKTVKELIQYVDTNRAQYSDSHYRLAFTSNHDENTWSGSEIERMGRAESAFAAFCNMLSNIQPLINTGQEVGFKSRLKYFDKDCIPKWAPNGYTMLYTHLNYMRHEHEVLWGGEKGGDFSPRLLQHDSILCIERTSASDSIVALFNRIDQRVSLDIDHRLEGSFDNLMKQNVLILQANNALVFKPWSVLILSRHIL